MAEPELLRPGNSRIKRLRRIVDDAGSRADEDVWVVEGPVLVAEALDSGVDVVELFAEVGVADELVARARSAGVPVHLTVSGALHRVLGTVTPRPIAALVAGRHHAIADLDRAAPVVVVVDLQDPGNVGTLIRTAEAAGCAGLVVAGASVDFTNPKVMRASAGALLRLPIMAEADPLAAIETLRRQGRPVVAATVDPSARPYEEVDLRTAAIVLGSEAHGLSPSVVAAADLDATIPLAGPTESLNVAAAGAVLCFASWQQRRSDPDAAQLAGQIRPETTGSL